MSSGGRHRSATAYGRRPARPRIDNLRDLCHLWPVFCDQRHLWARARCHLAFVANRY